MFPRAFGLVSVPPSRGKEEVMQAHLADDTLQTHRDGQEAQRSEAEGRVPSRMLSMSNLVEFQHGREAGVV